MKFQNRGEVGQEKKDNSKKWRGEQNLLNPGGKGGNETVIFESFSSFFKSVAKGGGERLSRVSGASFYSLGVGKRR